MPAGDAGSNKGFAYALSAFAIWGLVMPVYMKVLDVVPPLEILAHRVLWAIPCAALILWWQGGLGTVWRHFREWRTLALAALTAAIISINWGVYIYAIATDRTVEAALGYYINPLVNVLLGAIVLGERPNRPQSFAIGLAVIAVLILTVRAGGLPWISLTLAFSFGTYGLLRKMVPVGATEGFFLEVMILAPPSLAVLLVYSGGNHLFASVSEAALLIGTGPVTAIPLILFAAGARLLHYSTIGVLQYVAPTLIFLTAVFIFGEPFDAWQFVAFGFTWAALALYTFALFQKGRAARRALRPQGL
ncbi:EamA family transporter RarD [Aurantimonas marina]|uniref:EamA family transporter RarD n=1 Tax=Aurantimonas marina TaxID=2780508 RepID=UPI0019CF4C5F|nr:EamA family transporter RarD [Aurantimonas marina]